MQTALLFLLRDFPLEQSCFCLQNDVSWCFTPPFHHRLPGLILYSKIWISSLCIPPSIILKAMGMPLAIQMRVTYQEVQKRKTLSVIIPIICCLRSWCSLVILWWALKCTAPRLSSVPSWVCEQMCAGLDRFYNSLGAPFLINGSFSRSSDILSEAAGDTSFQCLEKNMYNLHVCGGVTLFTTIGMC